MRSRLRILFNAATAVSLALFLALAWLYFYRDGCLYDVVVPAPRGFPTSVREPFPGITVFELNLYGSRHVTWSIDARPLVGGMILFALLPLRWFTLRRRSAQRARRGLCPQCGYDLRASPDWCPECGADSHRASEQAPGAGRVTGGIESPYTSSRSDFTQVA